MAYVRLAEGDFLSHYDIDILYGTLRYGQNIPVFTFFGDWHGD